MALRKIEPKSLYIRARAGYTKSGLKEGRANDWWLLPSDDVVAVVAMVAAPTIKKTSSMYGID